jgi:hypothetical protein
MLIARFFVLALATMVFTAQAQPEDVQKNFKTSSGKLFTAEIQQHTPADLNSPAFRSYGHWGAEGATSSFCISSLRITRQKQLVGLSAKHYVDLCNVTQVVFTEKGPNIILTLTGGDAAYSFTAEFVIHGNDLIERTVRDGEFPQVYERTRFSRPLVVN